MPNIENVDHFLSNVFSNPEAVRKVCDEGITLYWNEEPFVEGIDALIEFSVLQMECFANFKFEIVDIVEAPTKVAVRLIQSGELQTAWEGVEKIGSRFSVGETMFFHFKNGKICDVWPLLNIEEKKRQLVATDK